MALKHSVEGCGIHRKNYYLSPEFFAFNREINSQKLMF